MFQSDNTRAGAIKLASTLALLVLIAAVPLGPSVEEIAVDGDIVLHKSQSSQAKAIEAASGSPYTHVGMVFRRNNRLEVIEGVQPVKWTPLDDWLARGKHGHVAMLRVDGADATKVRAAAEAFLGRPYDTRFEWSDDRIYCSELVTKAYRSIGVELGELAPITSLDLSSPVVGALMEARGGAAGEHRLVTPVSILRDADVRMVYTNDPALQ